MSATVKEAVCIGLTTGATIASVVELENAPRMFVEERSRPDADRKTDDEEEDEAGKVRHCRYLKLGSSSFMVAAGVGKYQDRFKYRTNKKWRGCGNFVLMRTPTPQ
jgi:hypothetical protein